jgi:outer membrane protein TolC
MLFTGGTVERGTWTSIRAWAVLAALLFGTSASVRAQETSYSGKIVASFDPAPAPPSDRGPADQPVAPWADRPFPINLATAFQLAGVQPIDVAVASQQIQVAASQLTQANLLWLPTIMIGPDYSRHDGQIQDVQGDVAPASKQSFMVGAGPYAVFAVSDAIFEPLAARRVVEARNAALQTARNDSLLAVAEAYFTVQQARGDLASAEDVARRAHSLVQRVQALSQGLVPRLEVVRARTQARRSQQAVALAHERWRTASADLIRVLRLDATTVAEPVEPPHLQVTLVAPDQPVEELVTMGLTNRPELSGQQALVQSTLARIRQEKMRPFLPSILARGTSTSATGTLAGGFFGGGTNDDLSNFGGRFDYDVTVLWELKELGFGNYALVRQRQAENEVAVLELSRLQDRVAAEVVKADAGVRSATIRQTEAEAELKDAVDSADKNLEGLRQTRSVGNMVVLVVRPQEAVASLQALAQAYADYYGAIADYDRAQFRLYHALGHPAQAVANHQLTATPAPPTPETGAKL